MQITLVTPADKRSRSGNRTTAARWAGILRDLGHRVRVALAYEGEQTDLLIALHAWRSAESVRQFRDRHPEKPLIVGLAGTDIYRFIESDPLPVIHSLTLADALVGLQDLAGEAIPERFRHKLAVIFQSAEPLPRRAPPLRHRFEVLVIGHLRAEKDPLRAAQAARLLPADSRIRVRHLGRALDAEWEAAARAEMAANPRYRWEGEVPFWRVRRALARAPLLALTSRMEGGANVVSEALAAGVAVIASAIPGTVGLLGRDYPGYFSPGDASALADLMLRAERNPGFLAELARHCAARARLFDPAREREAWRALLARIGDGRARIAAPALDRRQAGRARRSEDTPSGSGSTPRRSAASMQLCSDGKGATCWS